MLPWERQENEPTELFDRFQLFLALGPKRKLTELGRKIGVTSQGLGKNATRYGWRERAAAWDASNEGATYEPDLAPPAEPPPLPPPPPPIEPEILEGLSAVALEDQSTQMRQYSNAFRKAGKSMLAEAESAQLLAVNARESLGLWWEMMSTDLGNREERGLDLDRAARVTRLICDLTQAYWKTIDARCKLTEGARTHWGDSAALHQLIRQNFGA